MDINIIQILLILIIALLAGFGSVLDQFQFHQPIVTCTLIGLASGDLTTGLIVGGSLQLIALGWMNIGAAIAPDAAMAGVVAAILGITKGASIEEAIAIAIPLSIAGQVLTIFVRTTTVGIGHWADASAERGNMRAVGAANLAGLTLQGLRVAIPSGLVLAVPAQTVTDALEGIPSWIVDGLAVGGGMVVAVGYALVINMMASKRNWPFFFLGFALAAVTDLNLIAMGIIGVSLALIYLQLSPEYNRSESNQAGTSNGDGSVEGALDEILENY